LSTKIKQETDFHIRFLSNGAIRESIYRESVVSVGRGACQGRHGIGALASVQKFLTKYRYVSRSFDAQPNAVAIHLQDRNGDFVADDDAFVQFAAQDQHGASSFRSPDIISHRSSVSSRSERAFQRAFALSLLSHTHLNRKSLQKTSNFLGFFRKSLNFSVRAAESPRQFLRSERS
jgi:hypothetical protein